jgi:spore coat polysaccharide biosynthesis protein SpsF
LKIVTIIQARMGSTRLPGKVLQDLGGQTVLARVVNRIRRSRSAGEVVIATTTHRGDDVIADECRRLSAECFRGQELDVLDRYYQCARAYEADAVVRICSDCPMIEPEITDKVIDAFLEHRPDYASNTVAKTYPRGLDTEILTIAALSRAWRNAKQHYERVHVTPYVYQNPGEFQVLPVVGERDYGSLRWTLDTEDDLQFIRAVYQRFDNDDRFYWRDAIALLECEPALVALNAHVTVKALLEG